LAIPSKKKTVYWDGGPAKKSGCKVGNVRPAKKRGGADEEIISGNGG